MKIWAMTVTVAALGLACVGIALAADDKPRSRVEVVAELTSAQASGWIEAVHGEDSGSAHLSLQPWLSGLQSGQGG
jgi:hypothetical protein